MITKEAVPVLLEVLLGEPLTDLQQSWLDEYNSPSNVVHVAGERASGRTSFTLALFAILSVLEGYKSFVVITMPNQPHQAESHMKVCTHYIEKLVSWISFKADVEPSDQFEYRNRGMIGLTNGSHIYFRKQSSCALRGMTMSGLFLDLCVPTIESLDDEFMACVIPCIATGSKLFVSLER